jgi:hypothetical protein
VTDAVVVSVADFSLASAVAERAVVSGFGLIDAEPALAAVVGFVAAVAERAVASGLALIFAARARAAAGLVSVFALAASVLAERDVPVVSGLALIFFEPVLAADLVFVVVAFHADRAFALPAVLAAHRPLC